MIRAYSIPDVRAAEERAMAGLPEGELMQRAARGLAGVVRARARERGARTVAVLVGPGDNGGDALYAAALLSEAGLAVTALVPGITVHTGGERAAYEAGVVIVRLDRAAEALDERAQQVLAEADIVLDGMLGIGARPGLRGAMAALADGIDDHSYVVAVDLPSGTDPEGLVPAAAAVHADETVTFGIAKPVHLLPGTEPSVGRLTVVDIGVPEPERPAVERLTHDDVAGRWPVPGPADDKYSRGVLGVVAGSDHYPGAAVLVCSAAVGAGAGMVRYVGPDEPRRLVLAACPEVVPGPGRVQAWVVGPGVPPDDEEQRAAVRAALLEGVPVVADAGALDVVAELGTSGGLPGTPLLLTPHAGELARLLEALGGSGVTREDVLRRPLDHAREAARRTGATVLLKGATTVVTAADGPARSQADAPAWLATAGAGDVLAGLAGTLLSAGLDPLEAGSLAALVHGVAADRAAAGGPLRARAVAEALPGTVAHLLTRRGQGDHRG